MMLTKLVMAILDLPVNIAEIEAKKKLHNTYMVVNGAIWFVKELDFASGCALCTASTKSPKYSKIKVDTLSTWLPETGLYPLTNGVAVLIVKLPKRQWLKSYSDTYYSMKFVGQSELPVDPSFSTCHQVYLSKKTSIFVDASGFIYYFDKKIGYVKDSNTLVCTDSKFLQELKDWERDNGYSS